MKIAKKYERLVFAFFMALTMSALISFFMVVINMGFGPNFLITWVQTWGNAFIIAFPAATVLPKLIIRIIKTITFVDSK